MNIVGQPMDDNMIVDFYMRLKIQSKRRYCKFCIDRVYEVIEIQPDNTYVSCVRNGHRLLVYENQRRICRGETWGVIK